MQSQGWLRDLEVGTQSQGSEDAQRNLKIARNIYLDQTWIINEARSFVP